jgi:hypothetical protein
MSKTYRSDLSSLLLVLSDPSFFFFAFFSLRFSLLLLRNPVNWNIGSVVISNWQYRHCTNQKFEISLTDNWMPFLNLMWYCDWNSTYRPIYFMNRNLDYNSVLMVHSVNDCSFIKQTTNITIRDINQKKNRKVLNISSIHT